MLFYMMYVILYDVCYFILCMLFYIMHVILSYVGCIISHYIMYIMYVILYYIMYAGPDVCIFNVVICFLC
jgi:hypothetical protein